MTQVNGQCPICLLENQKVVGTYDHRDKTKYDCYRCGSYKISSIAENFIKRGNKSSQLSGWLRERKELGIEIPELTESVVKDIISNLPSYNPLEKQNKLLNAIKLQTEYPGKSVPLIAAHSASLAWAQNEDELRYYLKSLMERGLLENIGDPKKILTDPMSKMVITAKGWEHLENDTSSFVSKTQSFVAMSFDSNLLPVYKNAIAPAIEAAGYRPYRVDSSPHIDRIDAKIIAEIRNSRFLVADVTQQKSGVYYEAGFAYGLGLPVIWCVRHDDLVNVHFDTRQYFHIVWQSEADLRERLADSIIATIGKKLT